MLNRALETSQGRYLVVGVICALANNAILIGGDAVGLHYALCILLTFVLVLPLAYLIQARWTFGQATSWFAFGSFVGVSFISTVVAGAAVGLYRGALDIPMVFAGPLATVTMTVYNYLMTRWAVGRGRRRGSQSAL